MNTEIHIHFPTCTCQGSSCAKVVTLQDLQYIHALVDEKLNKIMATQAEAAQLLRDHAAKLDKIAGETQSLLDAIEDLKEQLANEGEVSPELTEAINLVIGKGDAVDALVNDTPPVEPPVEG